MSKNLLQVDGVPSVEGSDAAFCQENSGPPLRSEEEDSGRRRAQEEKERFPNGRLAPARSVWGVGAAVALTLARQLQLGQVPCHSQGTWRVSWLGWRVSTKKQRGGGGLWVSAARKLTAGGGPGETHSGLVPLGAWFYIPATYFYDFPGSSG